MKSKKVFSVLLSSLCILTIPFTRVHADNNENQIVKLAGRNRVETSIITSNIVNSDKVVIASGYNFADSLSAFNVAGKERAKLILIDKKTNLDSILKGKSKVFIIGGSSTISDDIENNIKRSISDVVRLAGTNRYKTNEKTLEYEGYTSVGVADGNNYPDALSASGLLLNKGLGLLLVDGSREYNTNYNVVYTFGGKKSVVKDGGMRISGSNRYSTSDSINKMISNLDTISFTSGENYADALSAINVLSKSKNSGIELIRNIKDVSKTSFNNTRNKYAVGNMVYKENTVVVNNNSPQNASVYNFLKREPNQKEIDNIILNAYYTGDLNKIVLRNTPEYYTSSEYLTFILKSMLYSEASISANNNNYNAEYAKKQFKLKLDNPVGYYTNEVVSKGKYKEHLNKLREIIKASGVREGDSTRNKVILVGKYLKTHYDYYYEYLAYKEPPKDVIRNAAGPFTITDFNKSICSGYTGVFNQIMFLLGIPSYSIDGQANWESADHSNAYTYFNGEWHEINVTGSDGYIKNINEEHFSKLGGILFNKNSMLVQDKNVLAQKKKSRGVYQTYKDFYLRINPDLEKTDNSIDDRFNLDDFEVKHGFDDKDYYLSENEALEARNFYLHVSFNKNYDYDELTRNKSEEYKRFIKDQLEKEEKNRKEYEERKLENERIRSEAEKRRIEVERKRREIESKIRELKIRNREWKLRQELMENRNSNENSDKKDKDEGEKDKGKNIINTEIRENNNNNTEIRDNNTEEN